MALIISTCLLALTSFLCRVSAQSTGRVRTYAPVTLVEQCQPCASISSSSSTTREDLSALLSLARALDSDREREREREWQRELEWERERRRERPKPDSNISNNVDVDSIITKLINALVLATTRNTASSPGYDANTSGGTNTGYGSNSGYGTNNGGRGRNNGEALLDLSLLDPDTIDNLLNLRAGGKNVVGISLGDRSGSKEGTGGAVGGLLDGVGGVVGGLL